jgi:hypothetical protein
MLNTNSSTDQSGDALPCTIHPTFLAADCAQCQAWLAREDVQTSVIGAIQ